jgi:hypothetical protein
MLVIHNRRRKTMNFRRSLAIVFCFILACMVFLPVARADEWNQMTKLEFSQPVEIPGTVLPAGTYWFVLLNNRSDRNIVQIFSSDWSKLYATLFTVSTERMQPTVRTEIKFAERLHSQPEALWKWYYPGLPIGHEFMYPTKEEKELTRDAKQDLLIQPTTAVSNSAAPGA